MGGELIPTPTCKKSGFGKSPGKSDDGKIWEKLQGKGDIEAGFEIQGKTPLPTFLPLNSIWKNDHF